MEKAYKINIIDVLTENRKIVKTTRGKRDCNECFLRCGKDCMIPKTMECPLDDGYHYE